MQKFNNIQSDSIQKLDSNVLKVTELAASEQDFLSSLVLKYKPKKILEIGVSAGGSSAIILNTIKDLSDSHLYSVDYENYYYRNRQKPVGYVVKEFVPHLADKWTLFHGDLTLKFIEKIGNEIDFCFIDAMHYNPGEILDFLMVLPYLKKNAIVVFHDISLIFNENFSDACTNCTLMSAIKGEKILPEYYEGNFPNIGAIKLDEDIEKRIFDIFNLILLPWSYKLNDKDYNSLINHFEKHYEKEYVNMFKKSKLFYDKNIKNDIFAKHNKVSLLKKIRLTIVGLISDRF